MNPEQWLSLKWNGGSTMSDRWLNQSKIIHIAEELWIYSKIRKLLREEENTMYYIDKLKEVEDKIESMKKEIICHLDLDTKIIKYVINLCDKVYEGASFGDLEFNETIKEIQEKYN